MGWRVSGGKRKFLDSTPGDHRSALPVAKMATLTSDECRQLLSAYETALNARIEAHRSKSAGDLVQLDSWRLNELSKAVRTRKLPFMTKDELEKLMECKL